MKTISAVLLALTLSTTPAIARTSSPQMPKAIQGTWFPNDSEGKQQCAAYRQKKDESTRASAIIITPKVATAYNPDGKDEIYELQKVKILARQVWRLTVKTIPPGGNEPKIVDIGTMIKQGQLSWSTRSENLYSKCL